MHCIFTVVLVNRRVKTKCYQYSRNFEYGIILSIQAISSKSVSLELLILIAEIQIQQRRVIQSSLKSTCMSFSKHWL